MRYTCHRASTALDVLCSILSGFLRTIIFHLSELTIWHEKTISDFQAFAEQANLDRAPVLSELQEVLNRIVMNQETPKMIVIIDALDECRQEGATAYSSILPISTVCLRLE